MTITKIPSLDKALQSLQPKVKLEHLDSDRLNEIQDRMMQQAKDNIAVSLAEEVAVYPVARPATRAASSNYKEFVQELEDLLPVWEKGDQQVGDVKRIVLYDWELCEIIRDLMRKHGL